MKKMLLLDWVIKEYFGKEVAHNLNELIRNHGNELSLGRRDDQNIVVGTNGRGEHLVFGSKCQDLIDRLLEVSREHAILIYNPKTDRVSIRPIHSEKNQTFLLRSGSDKIIELPRNEDTLLKDRDQLFLGTGVYSLVYLKKIVINPKYN